jgi:hypothetical protein
MKKTIFPVLVFSIVILSIAFFFYSKITTPREITVYDVGWKATFDPSATADIPEGWRERGKPGTPLTDFTVKEDPATGDGILYVESNKASGSLITLAENVDLKKTPFLVWRWKVDEFPEGADGRTPAKDDQAIGIYIGDGSIFNNKSVSYRWDTETPVGTEGSSVYGAGTVRVKWITLRNKKDGPGKWFTESRNCLEDYKKAWGSVPKKLYISITSNSQYTGTRAEAAIEWIKLSAGPEQQ